jgi:CubicO group peptidase (beta-lactamase class C family)
MRGRFEIEGALYRTWRTMTILLPILALLAGCSAQAVPAPSATASTVPRPSTPSVDSVALQQEVEDYIGSHAAALDSVRAVLVVVDGQTRLEYYRDGFAAGDYEHLWSVTKSVVSTLVGIAIGEGLIPDLDTSLQVLLPEYRKV